MTLYWGMENKIKEGMIVRWRWIGDPKMTVKEVIKSKYTVCQWFVDDKLHETRINAKNLEIVFCQHNLNLRRHKFCIRAQSHLDRTR